MSKCKLCREELTDGVCENCGKEIFYEKDAFIFFEKKKRSIDVILTDKKLIITNQTMGERLKPGKVL